MAVTTPFDVAEVQGMAQQMAIPTFEEMHPPANPHAARDEVFGLPELLERILSQIPHRRTDGSPYEPVLELFVLREVSYTINRLITSSPLLFERMTEPTPRTTPVIPEIEPFSRTILKIEPYLCVTPGQILLEFGIKMDVAWKKALRQKGKGSHATWRQVRVVGKTDRPLAIVFQFPEQIDEHEQARFICHPGTTFGDLFDAIKPMMARYAKDGFFVRRRVDLPSGVVQTGDEVRFGNEPADF